MKHDADLWQNPSKKYALNPAYISVSLVNKEALTQDVKGLEERSKILMQFTKLKKFEFAAGIVRLEK